MAAPREKSGQSLLSTNLLIIETSCRYIAGKAKAVDRRCSRTRQQPVPNASGRPVNREISTTVAVVIS